MFLLNEQYPKYLCSKALNQYTVVSSHAALSNLLERDEWRELPEYKPLSFPRRVRHYETGEERTVSSPRELESLSASWIEIEQPVQSDYPCARYGKVDGEWRWANVQNAEEAAAFCGSSWINGHEYIAKVHPRDDFGQPTDPLPREMSAGEKADYIAKHRKGK